MLLSTWDRRLHVCQRNPGFRQPCRSATCLASAQLLQNSPTDSVVHILLCSLLGVAKEGFIKTSFLLQKLFNFLAVFITKFLGP